MDLLRSLGLSDDRFSMHRKPYELTQFVYGCTKLGALTPEADVVSIGAGHEIVLYWLANRVNRVVATDLYEGYWTERRGREGDPSVLERPDDFAPFPYRQDRLTFMKMDGRQLDFPDNSFDIAYSLSSIEHFGGVDGAAQTIREMTRVLEAWRHPRPGDRVRARRPSRRRRVPAARDPSVDCAAGAGARRADRRAGVEALHDRAGGRRARSVSNAAHGRAHVRHRVHFGNAVPSEASVGVTGLNRSCAPRFR
ncbi:MAG: class I SAM-dependent methyltransferase [Vicinamibacterales bacterium]